MIWDIHSKAALRTNTSNMFGSLDHTPLLMKFKPSYSVKVATFHLMNINSITHYAHSNCQDNICLKVIRGNQKMATIYFPYTWLSRETDYFEIVSCIKMSAAISLILWPCDKFLPVSHRKLKPLPTSYYMFPTIDHVEVKFMAISHQIYWTNFYILLEVKINDQMWFISSLHAWVEIQAGLLSWVVLKCQAVISWNLFAMCFASFLSSSICLLSLLE